MRATLRALRDARWVLGVPRTSLGVTGGSRGLVCGPLVLHWPPGRDGSARELDCSRGARSVPGDVRRLRAASVQCEVPVLLIVEKEAVFDVLVREAFVEAVPCVLVTGRGVPDVATRALVQRLSVAIPGLKTAILVDWNPSGIGIACQYRLGAGRASSPAAGYALPGLRLLGATRETLLRSGADARHYQPLTRRDRALVRSLSARIDRERAPPSWKEELAHMATCGHKAELEAEIQGGGVDAWLRRLAEETMRIVCEQGGGGGTEEAWEA